MRRNRGAAGGFVNPRAQGRRLPAAAVLACCNIAANQSLMRYSRGRGERITVEVIKGRWRLPHVPDLPRTLGDEIARMAMALERLRDLYQRGEVVDLQAILDAGRR